MSIIEGESCHTRAYAALKMQWLELWCALNLEIREENKWRACCCQLLQGLRWISLQAGLLVRSQSGKQLNHGQRGNLSGELNEKGIFSFLQFIKFSLKWFGSRQLCVLWGHFTSGLLCPAEWTGTWGDLGWHHAHSFLCLLCFLYGSSFHFSFLCLSGTGLLLDWLYLDCSG